MEVPWEVRQTGNEFCVFKKGEDGESLGCHDTRESAVRQMRALYSREGTMKHSLVAFSDNVLEESKGDPPNVKWLKAFRYSAWEHPKYGLVTITPEMGAEFKAHFDEGTLGREHLVTYEHGYDPAKGFKAAGSVLDIDPRDDGIWYKVMFTKSALQEIEDGEWRYISPEYKDRLTDPETNQDFVNVPLDLSITNDPFFKQQAPLNFSEHGIEIEVETDDTPKGGNEVDELLKKFAERLGIEVKDDSTEEDILKQAEELNKTIEPLRKAKDEGARARTFREAFPDEFKRMKKLEETAIESDALAFAESYSRFTVRDGENEWKSTYGFSQIVVDKIADIHRKFSLREMEANDLKELLDLIGDKGIVDYSEHGSSRTIEGRIRSEDPKVAFSEVVLEIQEKDEVSYEAAIGLAQMKYPELFEAYRKAIPQR
jgi:hypothetical protein